MANNDKEFMDPLEDIDPIMREAFSEEDIIENSKLDAINDELDSMLDDLESDDLKDDITEGNNIINEDENLENSNTLELSETDEIINDLNDILEMDEDEDIEVEIDNIDVIEKFENTQENEEADEEKLNDFDNLYSEDEMISDTTEETEIISEDKAEDESILEIDKIEEDHDFDILDEDDRVIDSFITENEDTKDEDNDLYEMSYPEPEVSHTEEVEVDTSNHLAKVEFPEIQESPDVKPSFSPNLFNNIPIEVSVELGRTNITLKDIYELGKGTIIELEKLTGETLDLIVNDQIIAKGEVVTVDNKYGLRIKELSEEKPSI